jgi:hypothetical protein
MDVTNPHHAGRDRRIISRPPRRARRLVRQVILTGTAGALMCGTLATAPVAVAASVTSATFTGGTGTVTVDNTLYAKQGQTVALNLVTSTDTKCVEISGDHTARQHSATAKSTWTFSFTVPAGDGVRAVTAAASPDFNVNNNCTGKTETRAAQYTVDNTGPVVSAALTPAPNAAGWNNSDVTVKWTAADAGSGVTAAQPFKTDSVSANGIVTLSAPAQTDRLGNTGSGGSVTVRVDKAKPTITAAETKNADGTTTVTFTCTDSNSGGGDASGIVTCLADGSTTNSKTVQPGTTVTGTATDKAGNTSTASVTVAQGDTTPPTLSGAPSTSPNNNGWYKDNVTVKWTAADPESGIPTPPGDTTIIGEGLGLTSTQTVKNGAGLQTTATSAPAVNIDRTAPTTGISGASNKWVGDAVSVTLSPSDLLSGVASTSYSLDGGPQQQGTSLRIENDGEHTLRYFSTDKAGNVEAAQTATIKVDRTAPSIAHKFAPVGYTDGSWTNGDVTVSFDCADQGGSGLAECTAPVPVSTEGANQKIEGTARDNAGNTTSDVATVSIDKTKPTIVGGKDRAANAAGWYNDDVTVSFACTDALSGIAACTQPQTLGQGENQTVTGTARDAAGNQASDTVADVDVDKTAPVLTGSAPGGWHTGDVSVDWTASDALSGLAGSAPVPSTVIGEGDNLSATTSVTDKAGNTTTTIVGGIKIDRTRPTTTASVSAPRASGWHDAGALVTLEGHDNLSGVAQTLYKVDGGVAHTYTGAFTVTDEGTHTVTFWSRDVAGNVEQAGAPLTLRIDRTAPVTTKIHPISPDSGWFVTSGIPFAFDVHDTHSGVAATYYTIDGGAALEYGQPFTADLSTGTHKVTYWSVDLAGNKEEVRSFDINVDTVAPTIKGTAAPAANAFGWNNTSVDVRFDCADIGSGLQTGVAGCAGDTTLENDGAAQSVKGDAVDVAGNRSSATVEGINIDKTRPTLSGTPTTDANGAGWYNGDVVVRWTGEDGLSRINEATQPANSTITGEGLGLSAGPVTIQDKAGNVSAPATVTGINIDRTAPVVAGSPSSRTAPVNGWYRDAVTVDFTCTDALSGVALCPTSKVLSGNGANQSVTSDPAADKAGNVSAGKTIGDINIDGTAPTTSADNQCTKSNGWCTGATANVVLTAADQAGLSGVKELRYSVNGGAQQAAAGARTTVVVPLDGSGEAKVTYFAVDSAGNVEEANTVALQYDNIAPTVTHTVTPQSNAEGWSNRDVVVHFDAKDNDAGSGIAPGSVTPDVTVDTETAGTVITGSAHDVAGNLGTDKVTVKLDKTAPSVSGAVVAGNQGNNGWYVGPVKVGFTCADALSLVATCQDDVVLTNNGANTATGKATDFAGNTGSTSVGGIKIDQENPTITGVNVSGGSYTLGAVPAATCQATDSFSGVQSCDVKVTGGTANGVGTFSYTATAVDKAGNTSTATGTYTVKYKFGGFLQPINDTAHQTGLSTSVFKAGSTVPVKFQLRNDAGQLVQAATAPLWLTPVKGSSMSAPVDESVYSVSPDSGSSYRYDATAGQYIYNWKTGTGGNYWRIGVKLDDGQTYYVSIGLR